MPLTPLDREPSATIRFVSHPLFSLPDAWEQIERLRPESSPTQSLSHQAGMLLPRMSALGKLCEAPLLSREEEQYLFLRMNFEKFLAQKTTGQAQAEYLANTVAFRNRILLANTRLLISIAGQFATRAEATEDYVSEGLVPLLKAVELFDVSRGWAFGTYATHVLRNHFRRVSDRRQKDRRRAAGWSEAHLAEVQDVTVPANLQAERAWQQNRLAEDGLALLPDVDQTILRARFGFDDPESPKVRSFAEVGEVVGLSKERVRVRAHRAIEQLRETFAERRWEWPELESLNLQA